MTVQHSSYAHIAGIPLPVIGLVACTLPVMALLTLLGGVDPDALFGAFLVTLGVVAQAHAEAWILIVQGPLAPTCMPRYWPRASRILPFGRLLFTSRNPCALKICIGGVAVLHSRTTLVFSESAPIASLPLPERPAISAPA